MLERLPLERGSPEERLSRLHPCSGVDSSLSLLYSGLSWCCVCEGWCSREKPGERSGNKVGLVARLSFPSQRRPESCVIW